MLVKLTLIVMAWYLFFDPPPFILPQVILQLLQEEMLLGLNTKDPKLPIEVSCFAQLASWTNCIAQAPQLAWSMYSLYSCLGLAGSSL